MPEAAANASRSAIRSTDDSTGTCPSIEVVLPFKIDLRLLRRQKRALIDIPQNFKVSTEQEEAVDGMLNMLDFIQDSIVTQGLAGEEEVFPQMPPCSRPRRSPALRQGP